MLHSTRTLHRLVVRTIAVSISPAHHLLHCLLMWYGAAFLGIVDRIWDLVSASLSVAKVVCKNAR